MAHDTGPGRVEDYALLSGNFPQAFSHLALVNSAVLYGQERDRSDGGDR